MSARIDLDALAEHIRAKLPQVVQTYFPEATRASNHWRIGDATGEKGRSIQIGDQGFFEHAGGEKGSHLTLLSRRLGLSIINTARQVAKDTGFDIGGNSDRDIEPIRPADTFTALSDANLQYLSGRGFDPALVRTLPIAQGADGNIALLHYTTKGSLAFAKRYKPDTKAWWSKETVNHLPWGMDVVTRLFPDAKRLYITEGHWDAITALQEGFPAISIPNGASNHHWLEICTRWIHSFEEVVLCYDNDSTGRQALHVVAKRINRPLFVPDLPPDIKDLNQLLQERGQPAVKKALDDLLPYNPPQVICAATLIEAAESPAVYAFQYDTPWKGSLKFQLRPHETTIFTGYPGHGKTTTVRQIITNAAIRYGARTFDASFEEPPVKTTRELLKCIHGHPDKKAIMSFIDLFDTSLKDFNQALMPVEELLTIYQREYQRHGTTIFVTDSWMCLDIDTEDNKDQKAKANMFRQFSLSIPAHHILIVHPRKLSDQLPGSKLVAPGVASIKGASEIGNMAQNVLSQVRNIPKEREIELAIRSNVDAARIAQIDASKPDSILQCEKQRETGLLPTIYLWRDGFGNFHDCTQRTNRWW